MRSACAGISRFASIAFATLFGVMIATEQSLGDASTSAATFKQNLEELELRGWQLYGLIEVEKGLAALFLHRDKTHVSPNVVRIWELTEYQDIRALSRPNERYKSLVRQQEIDCRLFTSRVVQATWYSESGGSGPIVASIEKLKEGKSSASAPGTIGAEMINRACSNTGVARTNSDVAREARPKSLGTGWLSESGYVVTANHVVAGSKKVSLVGKDWELPAAVVAADAVNDIAILSAPFPEPRLVGLRLSVASAAMASRVFTIGFPHPDVMGSSPKYTAGEVSSSSGIADDPRLLQISIPVQAGNSGGPVVNDKGEVVGIVSSKLSAAKILSKTGDLPQNVNYAVKARYIEGLIGDLGKLGKVIHTPHAKSPEELAKQVERAVFLIVAE